VSLNATTDCTLLDAASKRRRHENYETTKHTKKIVETFVGFVFSRVSWPTHASVAIRHPMLRRLLKNAA